MPIDRLGPRLGRRPPRRRPAVRARRRRLRRARLPRGQRLPEAVRDRGLHADRQRERADGRINDEGWDTSLSGWLEVSRLGPTMRVLVFSVGGGDARAQHLAQPRPRARAGAQVGARGATASSAATVATPARVADAVVVIPPLYADRITPHTEGLCAPSCGTCSCRTPRSSGRATKWESDDRPTDARERRSIGASSSSAEPASSAATSSARCSTRDGRRTCRRSTTTSHRAGGGTSTPVADDPRLDIVEGEVEDLDRLTTAMAGATAVVHLASNPDIARAMTDPTIDFDQGTQLTHCVVEAARRVVGRARALRVGERRVRRSRRTARPTSTTDRSSPSRPTARASSRARRSSRRTATCSACAAAPSGSATSSGPTRPTASASTSSASCSPTRPGSRSSATGRRASRTSTSTTSLAAVLLAGELGRRAVRRLQRRHRRLHHRRARSPSWRSSASDLDPAAVELVYSGGDRGWKGDVPVVRIATDRIRALGWENRYTPRTRSARRCVSMLDDGRAGRLW